MTGIAIFDGIKFGLLLSFLLGPVFFALIQTSITRGFSSGVSMALGVFFSDLTCVVLAYLGLVELLNNDIVKLYLGIFGGVFLVGYGLFLIINKQIKIGNAQSGLSPKKTTNFIKGYILNILNPFAIFYWLGVVSLVTQNPDYDSKDYHVFFTSTLLMVLATDITKAYFARKLQKFITFKLILWLNRITGLGMLIFGARILIEVVKNKALVF